MPAGEECGWFPIQPRNGPVEVHGTPVPDRCRLHAGNRTADNPTAQQCAAIRGLHGEFD
jgi:hypothetical protein